jgi:radical SAM superfamily enzyme
MTLHLINLHFPVILFASEVAEKRESNIKNHIFMTLPKDFEFTIKRLIRRVVYLNVAVLKIH